MKRVVFLLIFLAAYLLLVPLVRAITPGATPELSTDELIQEYGVEIKVAKDGTLVAVERILYDFGQLNRHGIFRTLPYTKINSAGEKFKLTFADFSVTNETGKPSLRIFAGGRLLPA